MLRILFAMFLLACGAAQAQPAQLGFLPSARPVIISSTFNGWSPVFQAQTGTSVVAAGTGYVVGDMLTLADGCATHVTLAVTSVSTSAVSQTSIVNAGACTLAPTGTLSVLSTTGTGTGATFSVPFSPVGPAGVTGSLVGNGGNTFYGAEQNTDGYYGQESTFIGDRAGGNIQSGNFILAMGHDACGIGAGTPLLTMTSVVCLGTDAGRNIASGAARNVLVGSGTAQNVSGVDNTITGNAAASTALTSGTQNSVLGGSAATTLATGSGNVLFGYKADVTAAGVNSSVIIGSNSAGGQAGARCPASSVCIGAALGNASVTSAAGKHVLLGANVGQTNLTSGTQEILIGYGLDMPSGQGNANNWINIGGALLARAAAPTVSSGFGTSPTITGGSSAGFNVNVGTGGAASTGVIAVSSIPAPNGWICSATDQTNPDTSNTVAVPASTTTVTLKNYSRTTGAAAAWAASDVVVVKCNGY